MRMRIDKSGADQPVAIIGNLGAGVAGAQVVALSDLGNHSIHHQYAALGTVTRGTRPLVEGAGGKLQRLA